MTHIETAPHECEGNLVFCQHGLSPYWAVGDLLINQFDGNGETTTEVDGETWQLELYYQKGGIAPRLTDDVGGERLYEYRIAAEGRGERKANFHIQPRFEDMREYDTGEPISSPFDHTNIDEAVNVGFSGSNLEPVLFRELLPEFVQALAEEGGDYVNPVYFGSRVHEMSNITSYERYVRIRRTMSPKIVGRTGIMQRLFTLCADEAESKVEYKANNEDIVGYNHRIVLPQKDAKRLQSTHRYGKQIKHYHPKHVRKKNESDPLFHPKVGVLLKKSLSDGAFDWSDRRQLRREIDETLVNLLYWSNVPVKADSTTYIADDHFEVQNTENPVELLSDPTPEIEAEQETLLVTALKDLTDSDMEVLETLSTDGSAHTAELAEETGRGSSTIYRALDRLGGLIQNDNGEVSFSSKKIEQEIAGMIESVEHQIENVADRVGKLYDLDTRQKASSAWEKWCNKYGAKIVDENLRGEPILRIDTALSTLKSTSKSRLQDVLDEGLTAWHKDGRDPLALREGTVKWTDGNSSERVPIAGALR